MDQLKTSPFIHDDDSIQAIKSGGPAGDKAMMSLYAKYVKDIRNCMNSLMSRYSNSEETPDDVVHDAYIIMLHKIQYESPVIKSVRGYWLGIARYIWLNQIRKKNKVDLVEDHEVLYGPHDDTPEKIFLLNERYQQIDKCMASCNRRCHEILLLWLSDYSMEEIAERLNLSGPAMARKIKHVCFKKLKKMVLNSNIFGH